MRVFVSGTGGLLGREAVRQLRAAGHEVSGCDVRWPHGVDGPQADVTLAAEVFAAIAAARPEAILHTAGLVGPIARRRPYATVQINVVGTLNLLEAARLHAVPRFVLCSTGLVYDEARAAGPRLEEAGPLGAAEVYGGSKLAAEALVGAYAANYGSVGVSLHFARMYGPLLERTEGGAMKDLGPVLKAVLDGHEVTVRLPAALRRVEYVHAADAARACVAALTAEAASGAYNVGSGEVLGLDEILDALAEVEPLSRRWVRRELQPPEPGRAAPAPSKPYALERARHDLGYRPAFLIREGLADILATLRAARSAGSGKTQPEPEA